MSYIKKTLTAGENIIVSKRYHWVFWFWPIIRLIIPFLIIIWGTMAWNGGVFSPFVMTMAILLAASFIVLLFILFIKHISTENVATNKRVIFKMGFIRSDTDELRNENIENIQIKQSIIGRIFGYGDLEFRGTGGSPVVFKTIPDPISVKKEI
ncbi:MAG: PH domain-containing protein, partial [Bdellovibrionales bacterium]|nr:PH domain-containing protein [Bdellovibrionales bacterium]